MEKMSENPINLEVNSSNERTTLLANGSDVGKRNSPVTNRGNSVNLHPVPSLMNRAAPLANSEAEDDDIDDREVISKPYPGIDDGFFDNRADEKPGGHPDVEVERVPTAPPEREPLEPPVPRMGPDGGDTHSDDPDEFDGKLPRTPQPGDRRFPVFPYAPGFGGGFDVEVGSNPDPDSIPDVNVYQHKKTLAQGMMDLALFSANANQLRYVLESDGNHPYFYPSMSLITVSLILQVAVGIGLIWNATYNVKNEKEICIANKISNFTIIGIFLVTVVNVFISAFGVGNPSSTLKP